MSGPYYSQSLKRGLAILTYFSAERPRWGIAEMANELRLSRAIVYRNMNTLVELGYLERDTSRRYRLGTRSFDLGAAALDALGLRRHSHAHLLALRERTRCTTSLAVLDQQCVMYVDRVSSFDREHDVTGTSILPGSRLPAYCTALGKVLLANLPPRDCQDLLDEIKLAKRGPKTITNKAALHRQLEDVRASGMAINDEELVPRLFAIAAPVLDTSRTVVAAVSVAANSCTIPLGDLVDKFGSELALTAERISSQLK